MAQPFGSAPQSAKTEEPKYTLGATMLFEGLADVFEADIPLYEELHAVGYRGFQVNASALSDDYLLSLKQWADANNSEVAAIGFLVAAGDTPACPISDDADTRKRAFEQIQLHIAKAAMLGAVSAFGPYFTGLLNPAPQMWCPAHSEWAVQFLAHVDKTAREAQMLVEVEPLNRFEAPVSKLRMAAELLDAAGVGPNVKLGPDTCHQGFSERSTTESWQNYAQCFGHTLHLSDFGRAVLGDEQALTATGVFPFLREWTDTPIKSLYVEAFGCDVDRGIAAALGLKVLPKLTGRQVMKANFEFARRHLTGEA